MRHLKAGAGKEGLGKYSSPFKNDVAGFVSQLKVDEKNVAPIKKIPHCYEFFIEILQPLSKLLELSSKHMLILHLSRFFMNRRRKKKRQLGDKCFGEKVHRVQK